MNQVIETILNHRSIRKFEDRPLSKEQIEQIIACAQAASTSSYMQAYSIIGVTDKEKKEKLAELAGNQAYVAENSIFLVFCGDLHRLELAGKMEDGDVIASLESTEKFMVALIDAALAAQNAAIAAESMGLGICFIGGIRNQLDEVKKLLKTPERVIPLFGLAIGYPAKLTDKKPRLPMSNVYFENEYEQDETKWIAYLKEYNQEISKYYNERTKGKRKDRWTEQMSNTLSKPTRMYMKEFVQANKLDLR
jgi:FMN reductase (NADPH)